MFSNYELFVIFSATFWKMFLILIIDTYSHLFSSFTENYVKEEKLKQFFFYLTTLFYIVLKNNSISYIFV